MTMESHNVWDSTVSHFTAIDIHNEKTEDVRENVL